MSQIVYRNKHGYGDLQPINSEFEIGDYVKVIDPGHQYSTYTDAFKYFWGDSNNYYIPWDTTCHEFIWKIINMAVHPSENIVLYHIRTCDGKNAVVNGQAITLSNYHKRNRTHLHTIVLHQLSMNGNSKPHKWTEKLYEILK
jgi:hypothetical protein